MLWSILKFFIKLGITGGFIVLLTLFAVKYKTHITLQGENILFQSQYGILIFIIIFLFGFLFGIFFEKIKSLLFD